MVYALKQFRHYLLGRKFQLLTDHAPLQWLSAQKMQGLLCRWALAMQEYNFDIVYCKGSLNGNADALSRATVSPCALTVVQPNHSPADLRRVQEADPTIAKVLHARSHSATPLGSKCGNHYPLKRYRQLWPQLTIANGVLCRQYTPSPMADLITVPVLPKSLYRDALVRSHDVPTAGHQGFEKTLA